MKAPKQGLAVTGKPYCKDGRSWNHSLRKVKDKPCKECGVVFRPHANCVVFCKNECRLKYLHRNSREHGKFFGLSCWTKQEDSVVRGKYPNTKVEDFLYLLPGRTKRSVKNRADYLGVKHTKAFEYKLRARFGKDNPLYGKPGLSGHENPFYGRHHTEETKKRLSEINKRKSAFHRLNKDPEFQRKRRAAWHKAVHPSPNKKERFLDKIIQKVCPNEYKFVGDGTFIVDGLNPDWVNVNGQKKIIELFGRAFHHTEECIWKVAERRTYKGRKKAFARFGYQTLIIWDNELDSKESRQTVRWKLRTFNSEE